MFDDDHQINHAGSFSSIGSTFTVDCFGLFRPVKNLIFYTWMNVFPDNYHAWRLSAIAAFVGLIPLAYLFFGLFLKKQSWLQLLTTGFWASAPASTTVICWMSSTNIIFGGYGFFLYFLLYEKAQKTQLSGKIEKAYVWLFGALLMLAFSCFSYEAAMAAPFLLLLKDYVKEFDRLKDKRTWMFFFLSLVTLSLYFLLRKVHGGATNFTMLPTIPTESDLWVSLSSGWFYLIHALRWIWPFGQQGILIVFNPENHRTLVIIVAVGIVAFGVFLFWIRSRKPMLFLSLGWYAMALFPMANVIPLRNGPICDYYLFLPSIGLALFVSWLVQSTLTSKAKNWAIGVACVWVVSFMVTTSYWTNNWRSIKALAEQTVESQPDNFLILGTLAKAEMDLGNMEASESYIERGLIVAPWYSPLYYHKINLLIKKEEFEEAISILKDLTPKQENMAKPYVVLAYIYDINLGKWQEAEKLLTTALEKPWDQRFSKTGAMNLAYIYYRTDRRQFALQVYESLKERYPLDPEIAQNYTSMKEMKNAETEVRNPNDAP